MTQSIAITLFAPPSLPLGGQRAVPAAAAISL
jgi:hypothetical protein